MDRLTDFEILRKEHDILAKKLDRMDSFLQAHDDDCMRLTGEIDCTLDRLEQREKEQWHEHTAFAIEIVLMRERLDRREKFQSKMRDNIFTIRKRTDDIEENQARMEKLLEEIWGDI